MAGSGDLYIGVDVGGTKILAGIVHPSGEILARRRIVTPREGGGDEALEAIFEAIDGVLEKAGVARKQIAAIGVAVPGQIDPDSGFVINTPNMNLSQVALTDRITKQFGVPSFLGNDVRIGTLGEKWLGAARDADTAVGIFIGTGIGGGIISHGMLEMGARGIAGEVGHIIMQPDGPLCGCGNRGCFEALASRTAIERNIREALAAGGESVVRDLLENEGDLLKSAVLKTALDRDDALVQGVLRDAARIVGLACLSVRHLLDPDTIVLGGGVIEACGSFMMPIIREVVAADPLPGVKEGGSVVAAQLGDDSVLLGAVALARGFGRDRPVEAATTPVPEYPTVEYGGFGSVKLDGQVYTGDIYIRADAKVKKRKKRIAKAVYGTSHKLGPAELVRVCKGRPELLIVGAGRDGMLALESAGEEYLRARGIEFVVKPSGEAAEAFNAARRRRALLMHVTC